MAALQGSFTGAFSLMSQLGESGSAVAGPSNPSRDKVVIYELSQIIQEAESVIQYASWIFTISTAAFGLCGLSLVCVCVVFQNHSYVTISF